MKNTALRYSNLRYDAVENQLANLGNTFPQLKKPDSSVSYRNVTSRHVEGLFAIPEWYKLASTYSDALQVALKSVKKIFESKIRVVADLRPQHLRQDENAVKMMERIRAGQKDADILQIPGQLIAHQRSQPFPIVRDKLDEGEIGMGLYELLMIVWLCPLWKEDLHDYTVTLMGNEYSFCGDGNFNWVPSVYFSHGTITIGMRSKIPVIGGQSHALPATFYVV